MEEAPTPSIGHAWIPASIVMDADLSPYAYRVYSIIRLHDYGTGAGCYMARRRIAEAGHMCESLVIKSLEELRQKGYITSVQSTDGRSPSRHFCTDSTGVAHTPPPRFEEPTGVAHTPHGCSTYTPTGVADTPKVNRTEVDNEKYDSVVEHEPPVVSSCADAPPPFSEKATRAQASPPSKADKEERRQSNAVASFARYPEWVQTFCQGMVAVLGWKAVQPTTLDGWAPLVEQGLTGCSAQERGVFARWLFSSNFYANGNGRKLRNFLLKEIDDWKNDGKPITKIVAKDATANGARPQPASASWRAEVDREIAARTPTATTNAEFDRLTGRTPRAGPGLPS